MIRTFRNKGIGHHSRCRHQSPQHHDKLDRLPRGETYKGVTYQMYPADICHDDDEGNTYNWANSQTPKVSLSNKYDSERRMERHTRSRPLQFQRADRGKGLPRHAAQRLGLRRIPLRHGERLRRTVHRHLQLCRKATLLVGEYMDGNATTVKAWINATKVNGEPTSAAFDFPVRYAVRDHRIEMERQGKGRACQRPGLSPIRGQLRGKPRHRVPLKLRTAGPHTLGHACRQRLHPGFMRHAVRLLQTLIAYPTDIKMMINARHAAGIANTSNTTFNEYTGSQCNVLKTEGSYGTLYAVIEPTPTHKAPADSPRYCADTTTATFSATAATWSGWTCPPTL